MRSQNTTFAAYLPSFLPSFFQYNVAHIYAYIPITFARSKTFHGTLTHVPDFPNEPCLSGLRATVILGVTLPIVYLQGALPYATLPDSLACLSKIEYKGTCACHCATLGTRFARRWSRINIHPGAIIAIPETNARHKVNKYACVVRDDLRGW
jgi:hypothetical protein